MRAASVYVHFPYCLAKCPYCDFASVAAERDAIDHGAYADAVLAELDRRLPAALAAPRRFETVFFGGGTPSLWHPAEVGRVIARLRAALALPHGTEITLEANPTSLDAERAQRFVDAGVTRFSVGTQSTNAERLRFLGRLHDAAGARAAVRAALATGARVSSDLIFGVHGQAPEDAAREARELADLGLRHVSAYQLTIEPRTRFGELARRGKLPLADDGRVAESFVAVHEALEGRGLAHYEISNYAAPGEASRHNLAYWRGREYLGLGTGAVGMLRAPVDGAAQDGDGAAGVRWRNAAEPRAYVAAARALGAEHPAASPVPGPGAEREGLDAEALLRERLMLGLRTSEGFDVARARDELGVEPVTRERAAEAARLVSQGRLVREGAADGERWRVPSPAWLWVDDVAARLF